MLTLLHESSRRWRTLRAEGVEWRDDERSFEAFARGRRPGGVISFRGAPGPPEPDPRWQLWVRPPDQVRVEFDAGHGVRITEVTDGGRTWMRRGDERAHVEPRRAPGRPQFGPASVVVDTRGIPSAFDVEVLGSTEVLGRACIAVRARPVRADPGPPFFVHPLLAGADEVRLAVDAERGILLRLEAFLGDAPYYRTELTEVSFDEELPDEVFAIPAAPAAPATPAVPAAPAARGGAPPSRSRLFRHPGPPDDVLGEPADLHPLLVRTESVVVAVERVVAYPDGFELYLTVRTRDDQPAGTTEPGHPRTWGGSAAFPGESVRFGVVFSDGRRSFVDNFHRPTGTSGLVLVPVSGSGTAARFDQRFWVAALPTPGTVGLVVEWERRGVPETRVDVPAQEILDAAARAGRIWSD